MAGGEDGEIWTMSFLSSPVQLTVLWRNSRKASFTFGPQTPLQTDQRTRSQPAHVICISELTLTPVPLLPVISIACPLHIHRTPRQIRREIVSYPSASSPIDGLRPSAY